MNRSRLITVLCALALAATTIACSSSNHSTDTAASAAASKPAPPPIPAELEQVAESTLGGDSEVLVYGDLARTGRQQALIVNRLKVTPRGTVPGILLTRAVVAENDGGKWKEVFRCDEHLKNTNGFLSGTPIAAVTGWRLQYEQSAEKGLVMYFTPLQQPAGGYVQTLAVRWNPKVKRYESLDRNFENFLGEAPALDMPEVKMR